MATNLREQIAGIVEKIKSIVELTPENVALLDAFLAAPDEELPAIAENLSRATQEIDQIQAQASAEEQKLLDQYMLELKEIQTKAQRLGLEFNEAVDKEKDITQEDALLQQLNQQP